MREHWATVAYCGISVLMNTSDLQARGKALLSQCDYPQAVETLEEAIQTSPDKLTNYWYLGLAYLLQKDEETAQLVWFGVIAEQPEEDSERLVQSLVQTLETEAQRFSTLQMSREAWTIRHHICEFSPQNLTNLLLLIELSIQLDEYIDELPEDLGIIDLLQSRVEGVEASLLLHVMEQVLEVPAAETLRFAEVCLPHIPLRQEWAAMITTAAAAMAYKRRLVNFAIALVELCLQHEPDDMIALGYLTRFYAECQRFKEAVETAKSSYQRSTTLQTRFFSSCVLLQALMRAGDWQEIPAAGEQVKNLVSELIQSQSTQLPLPIINFLIVNIGLMFYLQDDLVGNRRMQNQAGQLFYKNIEANTPNSIKPLALKIQDTTKRLKIGYIASTLRDHSVGWLSRWMFQNHDREAFEISVYLMQHPDNEFFKTWFAPYIHQVHYLSDNFDEAADTIRKDEIDILVDLDSFTLDQTCTILALKPSPIQVTWLGCDASGLPTVDYFIADPYVLPDHAQEHYQEKIWRLPHTYIAVDGFEIGIPTLRRSDLEIPEDAVLYWSSQVGHKRNPSTVKLQMQILRQVPNSYFLIKGLGDQIIIRDFFTAIAEAAGIAPDRLRFLPMMPDEYTHRANIQMADVVLDTYPYNGATTTLETLWAGIPLVTRVGQQFAARNSYTFLMNAGISEGIAWTDEAYVEWGVRLGQDEALRQQVSWKLRQSRNTSPLWNTKQFTHDMENAYREMWRYHIEINR
jgi:predicted O-linked N-acetylglucosamine transferase (SPINDLY family)